MINIGKFIDETGKRYGSWTVIKRDEAYPSVGRWVCKCDCGAIKTLYGSELRRGRSKSCGCELKVDLTGQVFGKLTVIARSKSPQKWLCRCECGKLKDVFHGHLISGRTCSCGQFPCKNVPFEDLSGQKFGLLTVIERDWYKDSSKGIYFKCQCECGNIKSILGQHLKKESIISCGCYNKSRGEEKIKRLLKENNYDFKPEHSFDDLKFETGKLARFDFKVNLNGNFYLIEFDGKQHFSSDGIWGGAEELAVRQAHDEIKNNYCIENNIPLIRIPYTRFKSLKIKDLELYSSKYIVNRGWLNELPQD